MRRLIFSSNEYEKKLALIEESRVSEFLIERENQEKVELSGNFYKGRIVDILDGMESVFVDIGLGRSAFLNIAKEKNKKININDEILVQIEKNPRDEKGAKLTLDYSVPSKNLVLLANSEKISISNKIVDKEERERLKNIFSNVKKGLIIRTSAISIDEEKLKEEYESLLIKWENIKKNFEKSKSAKLIYSQNSIIEKLFREYFDENIEELIVNNEEIFIEIQEYIEENKLENLRNKVKRYFKDEDIFNYYGINVEIENALRKKVWLPSGAYIVIEKTEALISVDVNTGRNIETKNLEKIIVQTNLEATVEIARQLRLRNLAGIIIIDFIDMKKSSDRKLILKTLENELKKDKMKTNIIDYSSLNLVQLTRKREGHELAFYYQEPCLCCGGTGLVKSQEAVILEILKELKTTANDKDIKKIEIRSKKEIIKRIKKDFIEYIEKILEKNSKEIVFLEGYFIGNEYEIDLYK